MWKHARIYTHTHTQACMTFRLKLSVKWSLCGRVMLSVKDTVEVSQPATLPFTPSSLFFQQGSQDSAGGQEGLVPPPFSAFPPPPPPPPQNGLALDYGGSLYAAGAVQGPVEAGGAANSAANVANSLSGQVSASSSVCSLHHVFALRGLQECGGICVSLERLQQM